MQKVYLLLRSNQQTGPHSLEELLQFDLKPFDLIWIEGKSAGWFYPQEIDTLQPYLSFYKPPTTEPSANGTVSKTTQPGDRTAPKKIYVSLPANMAKEPPPVRTYTEPVGYRPRESASFSDTFYKPSEQDEIKATYNKKLEDVETDYMNWVYQKKTKKRMGVSPQGVFAACLLVGVASATWWMLDRTPDPPIETLPKQTASFVSQRESPSNKETSTAVKQDPVTALPPAQEVKKNPVTKKTVSGKVVAKTRPQEIIVADKTVANTDYQLETLPEVKQEDMPAVINSTTGGAGTAVTEKKKTRDKFLGIFKKKAKEDNEQAKPAEEEGGERRSVRREANMAQMVAVRFTVPNDWMMGIKGATATLTNRSNEALVKAVVEVIYYNEDNVVLDKKTVAFNSVKGKQTQTVSIPDHQTATRLEYIILSATGSVEPFASK
jgi:hypothetical protein